MTSEITPQPPTIGIVTLSDRAAAGVYADQSGPAVRQYLENALAAPLKFDMIVIADEQPLIEATLQRMCQAGYALVATTGGTGPAVRDVTPEATMAVCQRLLPGFGEAMRAASLESVPTAILSRAVAGVCERTLIVNLPGRPAAVSVCLDAVIAAIPPAVSLIGGPKIRLVAN